MRIGRSLLQFGEDSPNLIVVEIPHFPFLDLNRPDLAERSGVADFSGAVQLVEYGVEIAQIVIAGFGRDPVFDSQGTVNQVIVGCEP